MKSIHEFKDLIIYIDGGHSFGGHLEYGRHFEIPYVTITFHMSKKP